MKDESFFDVVAHTIIFVCMPAFFVVKGIARFSGNEDRWEDAEYFQCAMIITFILFILVGSIWLYWPDSQSTELSDEQQNNIERDDSPARSAKLLLASLDAADQKVQLMNAVLTGRLNNIHQALDNAENGGDQGQFIEELRVLVAELISKGNDVLVANRELLAQAKDYESKLAKAPQSLREEAKKL